MRRTAICLSALLVCVTTLSGCKSPQKQASADSLYDPADMYASTTPTTNYQTASYPSTTTPSLDASASMDGAAMGSKSHTVAKGDTLYGLARSYYGDHRRWKEIYEANRAAIGGNPNQIRVGQKLIIP